jgi:cyclophilin family peptidyl-prolyl cis-trans isomerase
MHRLMITAVLVWCGMVLAGISTMYRLNHRRIDHPTNQITLHLSLHPPVDIRMEMYAKEAPDAARFIKELIVSNSCVDCTIYRAEPVPEYWGSTDYPDRWFDGGRWGPPYALIQGQFQKDDREIPHASSEDHRLVIQRGMVAWAGGKGGPHFFIALANHPEWQHGHTVWAKVVDEDMPKVELLLHRPLKKLRPKTPPILSYFVDPVEFSVSA